MSCRRLWSSTMLHSTCGCQGEHKFVALRAQQQYCRRPRHIIRYCSPLNMRGWVYLKSCCRGAKLRIVLDNLVINCSAICIAKGFLESVLYCDISTIVFDIVDQFDCESQANRVHPQTLNLRGDGCNALVLKPLRNHHLACTGPIDANICEVLARGVVDPLSLSDERCIRKRRDDCRQRHSAQELEDVHLGRSMSWTKPSHH